MKVKPTIVAERMKLLREGVKLSQGKLASMLGMQQTAIFRYEVGQSFPPYQVLMKYADFFDVSLDYIFGRTDSPQGKLYDCQAKVWKDNKQMRDFIEMCFDPKTEANAKLKEMLMHLMEEQNG